MRFESSEYNPLDEVLKLFPSRKPVRISIQTMTSLKLLIVQGGIIPENDSEVMLMLRILEDMEILTLELTQNNELLVGNIYNGR